MKTDEILWYIAALIALVGVLSLASRACDNFDYKLCLDKATEVNACKDLQP
jgi:hypothetical protein